MVFLTGAVMGAAGLGMNNVSPPWAVEVGKVVWQQGQKTCFEQSRKNGKRRQGGHISSWQGCAEERRSCCWVGRPSTGTVSSAV